MAELAPVARQQFFKANGEPAANYKLYTRVSGSATPKATYQDEALGTANSNPITLDSKGYAPAAIWLDDDEQYRFILDGSGDLSAPEWTEDDIGNLSHLKTNFFLSSLVIVKDDAAEAIATDAAVGRYIRVGGNQSFGDAGGALYRVVAGATGTDDGFSYLDMDNGNQLQLMPEYPINVKVAGASVDGTTDDKAKITTAYAFTDHIFFDGAAEVSTTYNFTDSNKRYDGVNLVTGDNITLAAVKDVTDVEFRGCKFENTGSQDFVFAITGDTERYSIIDNEIRSNGFSLLVKPSVGTGGYADKGVIALNRVYGNNVDTDVGISYDGDARWAVCLGNVIDNVQRVANTSRDGHGLALAGVFGGGGPINEAESIFFGWNVVTDVDGNGLHVEDVLPRTTGAFNIFDDVKRGIEIVNDGVPFMHNYIGNACSNYTVNGIYCAGTGSSGEINFAFNLIDGSNATQTEAAVRINQQDTENINFIGNIITDSTLDAFESSAEGPMTLAYNIFKDNSAYAITGRSSVTDRRVLIESNNKFKNNTSGIVEKANSASLMGDQVVVSQEMDSNVAEEKIMFVAQRPGWVTAVTRVLTSAGGSGTANATFTVKKWTGASFTTILDNSVPRTGSQWDSFTWTGEHAQVDDNEFAEGDIIVIQSDGGEDAQTLFAVQVEFFYYN